MVFGLHLSGTSLRENNIDETCFTPFGYFNSRNSHIWNDENPHVVVSERHQQQFSVNKWVGIVGESLLAVYSFEHKLLSTFSAKCFNGIIRECPLGH